MCYHGTKDLFHISQKQSSPGKTIYPNPLLKVPLNLFFLPRWNVQELGGQKKPLFQLSLIFTCSSPRSISWDPCLLDLFGSKKEWSAKCRDQKGPPQGRATTPGRPQLKCSATPRWTISVHVSKNATCFRLALSSICSHNYTGCQRGRTSVRTKALCYMLINKVIKGHLHWRSRALDQNSASVFRTHKSSVWWCCVVGRDVAGNEGHLFVDVNLLCLAFINPHVLSRLVWFDSVEVHPSQNKDPFWLFSHI